WSGLYVVAGDRLYSVSQGHVVTNLGYVGDDGLSASMSHNIAELCCVSNGLGFVAQKTTHAFSEITDTEFPNASIVDFLDGYGMLLEKDSGRFHFTSISDFESISGIDFATAEGAPDELVSLLVDHRELWLFGKYSIEIWFNSGDASNPFQRIRFMERGCKGAYSPAKVDNTVFWLGDDNVVYRADEHNPIRVSNHGIENLIAKTSVDPIGFAYNADGHAFYQLNFPGELTVVYDASTQMWHRRKTRSREDCVYHHHAAAYGRDYVGGANGKLYYLDKNIYTHEGELERIRSFGPLRVTKYSAMSSLTALFETGENSDAVDPSKVWLEISDDGGRTYSSRIEASIGAQGQYTTEVKFLALGGFYDGERVLKLSMTDDARYTLVDVNVDVA
ncbi:MAG: hypothetical protein ACPGSC_09280, partial [Granulosicoccaceae bacterium]